jgi:hypothetical protein
MHGRKGAFTRRLLLPFGYLLVSILRMGKRGLQREMDSFFRETENEDFSIRRITKGGFSKSRRSLAPEAFPIEERVHKSARKTRKKDWSNICARSTAPLLIGRPKVF